MNACTHPSALGLSLMTMYGRVFHLMESHGFSPSQHDDDDDNEKKADDGQQHPQNNCKSFCCRELELKMRDQSKTPSNFKKHNESIKLWIKRKKKANFLQSFLKWFSELKKLQHIKIHLFQNFYFF